VERRRQVVLGAADRVGGGPAQQDLPPQRVYGQAGAHRDLVAPVVDGDGEPVAVAAQDARPVEEQVVQPAGAVAVRLGRLQILGAQEEAGEVVDLAQRFVVHGA